MQPVRYEGALIKAIWNIAAKFWGALRINIYWLHEYTLLAWLHYCPVFKLLCIMYCDNDKDIYCVPDTEYGPG